MTRLHRLRATTTLHMMAFFAPHLLYVRPLRGPSVHAQSPGYSLRHATGKGGLLG